MVMNLSHDLRTPLSILNTTRYLMEKNGTSENRESYLGTMQQQLDHLRLLATKLLTVARLKDPPAMTLEDTNLSEVVAAAVGRLSEGFRQKRIGLDVQLKIAASMRRPTASNWTAPFPPSSRTRSNTPTLAAG